MRCVTLFTNVCFSTVIFKVLSNQPQCKLGQLCTNRCSRLTQHVSKRRTCLVLLCTMLTPVFVWWVCNIFLKIWDRHPTQDCKYCNIEIRSTDHRWWSKKMTSHYGRSTLKKTDTKSPVLYLAIGWVLILKTPHPPPGKHQDSRVSMYEFVTDNHNHHLELHYFPLKNCNELSLNNLHLCLCSELVDYTRS